MFFAYQCQKSVMDSNPVSIVRRVKNQFVAFDLKSIEGSVLPLNWYQHVLQPWYLSFCIHFSSLLRWHGNASTRKRLNTETDQKYAETPQKPFFWGISAISSNFSEIPPSSNFEEFPLFFNRFPRIVYPFPLYFIQIF